MLEEMYATNPFRLLGVGSLTPLREVFEMSIAADRNRQAGVALDPPPFQELFGPGRVETIGEVVVEMMGFHPLLMLHRLTWPIDLASSHSGPEDGLFNPLFPAICAYTRSKSWQDASALRETIRTFPDHLVSAYKATMADMEVDESHAESAFSAGMLMLLSELAAQAGETALELYAIGEFDDSQKLAGIAWSAIGPFEDFLAVLSPLIVHCDHLCKIGFELYIQNSGPEDSETFFPFRWLLCVAEDSVQYGYRQGKEWLQVAIMMCDWYGNRVRDEAIGLYRQGFTVEFRKKLFHAAQAAGSGQLMEAWTRELEEFDRTGRVVYEV